MFAAKTARCGKNIKFTTSVRGLLSNLVSRRPIDAFVSNLADAWSANSMAPVSARGDGTASSPGQIMKICVRDLGVALPASSPMSEPAASNDCNQDDTDDDSDENGGALAVNSHVRSIRRCRSD